MARVRRILRRGGSVLVLDAALALAVLSLAVAAPWHGSPAAGRQLAVDASGSLALTNSRAGQAIFTGRGLRPGGSTSGTVAIGNPGGAPVTVSLSATASDVPGTGGGRLSSQVQLQVVDTTRGRAVTVYAGRLAALRALKLGRFAPHETHSYRMVAWLPSLGAADNAYQGATLTSGFTWTAAAAATPTPTPVPTAAPAPPVTAASVIHLPSANQKLKRKKITARFTPPAGRSVASAQTRVGRGKTRRYGAVTRVKLNVGSAKGKRVKVMVRVKLDDGLSLTLRRTYRRR